MDELPNVQCPSRSKGRRCLWRKGHEGDHAYDAESALAQSFAAVMHQREGGGLQ